MTTSIDGTLGGSFSEDRAMKDDPKRRRGNPISFIRAIWAELRKVVWPTRKEVTKYSIVVLFALVLMVFIITVLDVAFSDGAIFLFK